MFLLELIIYAACYRRISGAVEAAHKFSLPVIGILAAGLLASSLLLARIPSPRRKDTPPPARRLVNPGAQLLNRTAAALSVLATLWVFAGLEADTDLPPHMPGEYPDDMLAAARSIRVEGRVDADSRLDYRGRTVHSIDNLILTMENGSSFSRPGSAIFELPGERFFRGERLEIVISASADDLSRIPLQAGMVKLLHRGRAGGETPMVHQGILPRLEDAGLLLRRRIRSRILEGLQLLDNPGRAFVQSLVLGYRSGLPAVFSLVYRQAGVMHILVLSGMHLVLLYAGVLRLLPGFCTAEMREVIALLTILLYLAIINPGTSAFRAAGAIFCYSAANMAGVRMKPEVLLRLLWTSLVLVRPASLLDAGMYLSFAAVWGLMNLRTPYSFLAGRIRWLLAAYSNPFRAGATDGGRANFRKFPILRSAGKWIGDMVTSSLAAQSGVMPLALLLFSGFSPHSWIVLPLVILPFYVLFALCVGSIPLLLVWPAAAGILNGMLMLIIDLIHRLLFPFHLLGAGLNQSPQLLKLAGWLLFLLPYLGWQFYCVKHTLLVSSSHVQLRFAKGYPGASHRPGHRHAEALRAKFHDQPSHAGKGGGLSPAGSRQTHLGDRTGNRSVEQNAPEQVGTAHHV